MEDQDQDLGDSLNIYDGPYKQSPGLGQYCGRQIPVDIVTTSNNALLMITSDGNTQSDGFYLTWKAITKGQYKPFFFFFLSTPSPTREL